jgi:rare lipoprotein A
LKTKDFFMRAVVLGGALMALGACSETKLMLHAAKTIQQADPGPGIYKVGNPYQINGVWYYPAEDWNYDETGIASWYGPGFHEKNTANGEIYDQNTLTAAHKTLPMPSIVEVTNLDNGRSIKLRVNDRGPFVAGRIIDVSRRGAQLLGFHDRGTARVRVKILADESQQVAAALKGTVLARADSPIRTDVDVSRPMVGSETLAPPPGARSNQPVTTETPRARAPERAPVVQPPPLDGAVKQTAVRPTNIYVQVGSFSQYQNAYQVQAKLSRVSDVKVSSAIVNGKEFFRVRTGPLTSVESADGVLNQIIKSGYNDARIVVD